MNCKSLSYIHGNLPQSIINANSAFKNTGITEVNFFKENSFINDVSSMFESCPNLGSVTANINANCINNTFSNCKNLYSVSNIKGNSFYGTWHGCSNLQIIICKLYRKIFF